MTDAAKNARIGARIDGVDPALWLSEPQHLADLKALVDERLVVTVAFSAPPAVEAVAALARTLGCPGGPYPDRPGTVPGYGFIAEFSSEARVDDGRARTPAWIEERLHFDGDSAYSVQVNLAGTPLAANRFADMAALYADLPRDLKAAVDGRCALHGHLPATGMPMSEGKPFDAARARRAPLVVRHPRTGAPVLRPPASPLSAIEGLPEDEGRAILAAIWARAEATAHHVTLAEGEMLVWEGVGAAHTNPGFARDRARKSWFFTVPAAWTELTAHSPQSAFA
jgi:hypothetical protein